VVADFGHGLFEESARGALDEAKGFIGLNVQTNSSNFGYNVYTKHERFDYLCLDTREARLAMHNRFSDPLSIAASIRESIGRPFGFTAGAQGAYLLDELTHFSPAFSDVVIDATGAGDAYFAITTVLLASGCTPALVPFIGNVFAGLKTKIIGNKSAVSKVSLLKACKGILA
jgi:sugar/nucleoside kinase (ribokinase family)